MTLRSPAATILPPPVTSGSGQEVRPRVGIFDFPENIAPLLTALATMGYSGLACTGRGHPPDAGKDFAAAIVTDNAPDPLKLASRLAGRCPVVFCAVDLSFTARLAAARAGVDAVLTKPVDVSELADWLDDLTGQNSAAPFNILIVDDDEILAETYALALEGANMHATVASDPESALVQITGTFPDLVLMDMQMPGANGIELAKIIRQSRRNLSLPIVFLSAVRDPSLQLEARRLGGDDFITKPVDPERLVALVRMRAERAVALRSLMERDSLTGLLNHGRFKERLGHELERCRRTGAEISLAMLDLDRFKQVNDTHGHLGGDRVLRALAHALTAALRRIDIIGRYGGEEFAVILLDTPPHAARVALDKIRERFSGIEFESAGGTFTVTFSAGIESSRNHSGADQLIAAADRALYRAKVDGRNRITA